MKIVVATDFSETAGRASEVAIAIARRSGDALVILHVVEPPTSEILQLATDVRTWEQALRDRARADLRACTDEAHAQGIQSQERLESGAPPQAIAAVAKEVGARLLVLGSHGRGPVRWFLLGSVAQETLFQAECPMIVVRRGSMADGVSAWAAGDRPLRVTFAVDRSQATAAAAAWVRWLHQIGPVETRLVHAYDPAYEAIRRGIRGGREEWRLELEAVLARELRDFLGEVCGDGWSLSLRASVERPGDVVADEARAGSTDLLVVGTHRRAGGRRLWLGSNTELALRHADVPVVCVPTQ